MHPALAVVLLVVVNSTPLVLLKLFPSLGRWPLDGHIVYRDGFPLLGKHKTVAGFAAGMLAGGLTGIACGISFKVGLVTGLFAMAGDSCSSFVKRRLGMPEGTDMPLWDQVWESAWPLIFLHYCYAYRWSQTYISLLVLIGVVWSARHVRMRMLYSPLTPSPRLIRSTRRFKEWRACHTALSPFARYLNFENLVFYKWGVALVFRMLGLYKRGLRNAMDVRLRTLELHMDNLPRAFDRYRILFMTDLHIDGPSGLFLKLVSLLQEATADICLLGGDYRMEMYGPFIDANRKLCCLVGNIKMKDGVYGVLGNHDCLGIAPDLESAGIHMLINDAVCVTHGGENIYIAGVDDPHYYACHSLPVASMNIPKGAFAILLSHSPEIINDVEDDTFSLCLCGHTHGGQIRLPGLGAVFTHCKTQRKFTSGLWRYRKMAGYTSNGVGVSGVPLRFNCPPEVVLIRLHCGVSARSGNTGS